MTTMLVFRNYHGLCHDEKELRVCTLGCLVFIFIPTLDFGDRFAN